MGHMPTCRSGHDMLRVDSAATISIIALTSRTRTMLCILVCVPKLAISVYLLILGCKWLSATTSFEALVMNTMAMEFVLHIDELLYEAFLPAGYRRQVSDINFFLPNSIMSTEELKRQELWSYGKAIFSLCGAVGFVFLWADFLQVVLPQDISDVTRHCAEYLEGMSPICSGFAFWRQSPDTCYPVGGVGDMRPNLPAPKTWHA